MIILQGTLPNMLENGSPAYDMRQTVLSSPKAKTSKAGFKFMAIPFRHGTPGSAGLAGKPMGQPYAKTTSFGDSLAFSGGMDPKAARRAGREIYNAAKSGQPIKTGDAGLGRLRERHASGLYEGMKRVKEPTGGGQYMTFRMISTNPDSIRSDAGGQSWTHPGIKARQIFMHVDQQMKEGFN